MVRACVSGWTWSSGSQDRASVEGRGPGGEEDVRRGRYLRDFCALACGPVEERDRGEPGAVAEHGPQVPGRGGDRGHDPGRPGGEPGAVGGAGARMVPGAGRYPAAAGDVAGDRGAP